MANSLEKKKKNYMSDIFDFMETFQDNIFQSIDKENVPTFDRM